MMESRSALRELTKRQIDMCDFIMTNGCISEHDFWINLLSDVRAGFHVDWYGLYFNDEQFKRDVRMLTWERKVNMIPVTEAELKRKLDYLTQAGDACAG